MYERNRHHAQHRQSGKERIGGKKNSIVLQEQYLTD